MILKRKQSYGVVASKKSKLIFIVAVMFFQLSSITIYRYYAISKLFEEEFVEPEIMYNMDTLRKCTQSENKWLQCIKQLNNLTRVSNARVRGFDSSVRLIRTPINCTFLDIQIPFKINNKHYLNVTLNERYILPRSSSVAKNGNLTIKAVSTNRHCPKYFNVKEALNAIHKGLPQKEDISILVSLLIIAICDLY
ncbi:unnamed protein product [Trichobilharzia szidati]|nr:unnamed protein product [Trichobilharzia szidati]